MLAGDLQNLLFLVVSIEFALRQPKPRGMWRHNEENSAGARDNGSNPIPVEPHVCSNAPCGNGLVRDGGGVLNVLVRMPAVMPPHAKAPVHHPPERKVGAQEEDDPDREGEVRWPHKKDKDRGDESRCAGHQDANRPIYDISEMVVLEIEGVLQAECASE